MGSADRFGVSGGNILSSGVRDSFVVSYSEDFAKARRVIRRWFLRDLARERKERGMGRAEFRVMLTARIAWNRLRTRVYLAWPWRRR